MGSYLTRPLKTSQLRTNYFEPSSCECRVYGRLEQERRQGLAVRTHGYVLLTPEQELEVGKRCKPINPKDGPIDDPFARRDGPLAFDRPVHAIVKGLVNAWPEPLHFTPDQVGQLWNDLQDLHTLGILVRDVTTANYLPT